MRKEKRRGGGKEKIFVNIGLLAGLFGGAILGIFIGMLLHDIPLYTGFGMILGIAIAIDMTAQIRHKKEEKEESNEERKYMQR